MTEPISHDWNVTPAEAVAIQRRLATRVIRHDAFDTPHYIAGVDVGFEDMGRVTRAAVVVLSLFDLQPVAEAVARQPTCMPYVPGLLSFRELPAVLEAMQTLTPRPDMLFCDGQGIAHPRRLGIASHLGVLLDIPSIGVGKSRLIGRHATPGEHKGNWAPLEDHGERIGAVLRTRAGVKPLFISTGHRVSLESAIHLVLSVTPRYRLPETTRQADRLASRRGERFKY